MGNACAQPHAASSQRQPALPQPIVQPHTMTEPSTTDDHHGHHHRTTAPTPCGTGGATATTLAAAPPPTGLGPLAGVAVPRPADLPYPSPRAPADKAGSPFTAIHTLDTFDLLRAPPQVTAPVLVAEVETSLGKQRKEEKSGGPDTAAVGNGDDNEEEAQEEDDEGETLNWEAAAKYETERREQQAAREKAQKEREEQKKTQEGNGEEEDEEEEEDDCAYGVDCSHPSQYYRQTHPSTDPRAPKTTPSDNGGGAAVVMPWREDVLDVAKHNKEAQRIRTDEYYIAALDVEAPATDADDGQDDDENDEEGEAQEEEGDAAAAVQDDENNNEDESNGLQAGDDDEGDASETAPVLTAKQQAVLGAEDTTNAFALHGLLSPAECQYIIHTAEPLMQSLETQYAQQHRKADRAMIRSRHVARQLFERIVPHLRAETDYTQRIPLCFGQDGVWAPFGLNECLKVFRYGPGGDFVAHRDGPWVPRDDQCSMYTVVIYLNEAMRGGETLLLGTAPYCAPQGSRILCYQYHMTHVPPSTGTALLFNHDCWHAGAPVQTGTKYILRTELIFQRVQSFYVDRHAFSSDAEYQSTRALYAASQQALKEGRREDFFEQYQTVVALQQAASLRAEAGKSGAAVFVRLGSDCMGTVAAFLGVRLLRPLLCTSKRTFAAVAQCSLWETLVRAGGGSTALINGAELGGNTGSPLNRAVAQLTREHFFDAFRGHSKSMARPSDAFALYRQQVLLRGAFAPAALVMRRSGCLLVTNRAATAPVNALRYFEAGRGAVPQPIEIGVGHDGQKLSPRASPQVKALLKDLNGRYAFHRLPAWYAEWYAAEPLHMNQPNGERFELHAVAAEIHRNDRLKKDLIVREDGADWSVLAVPLDMLLETTTAPLLVSPLAAWAGANTSNNMASDSTNNTGGSGADALLKHAADAQEGLFGLLRCPAAALLHPALCAALGHVAFVGASAGSTVSHPASAQRWGVVFTYPSTGRADAFVADTAACTAFAVDTAETDDTTLLEGTLGDPTVRCLRALLHHSTITPQPQQLQCSLLAGMIVVTDWELEIRDRPEAECREPVGRLRKEVEAAYSTLPFPSGSSSGGATLPRPPLVLYMDDVAYASAPSIDVMALGAVVTLETIDFRSCCAFRY